MNEQTRPASLADALAKYDQAFLLTASAHGGPHAIAIRPRLVDGELYVAGLGSMPFGVVDSGLDVA